MPQYGTVKRVKPRLVVLRGFDPNEPRTLTQAAPVASGVTILSGQVISLDWNSVLDQYEWVLGGVSGQVPYIALQDSVDPDVVESGTLVGLSCLGQFELQTAYFAAEETYNVDVPLTYDGVTGDVKPTTFGSGEPILGVVTRNHGTVNLAGKDSSATSLDVVVFTTNYNETNAAS